VAIYEYRCERDGVFDIARPLGTAPQTAACPACGHEAARVISLPTIKSSSRSPLFAAIEHAEKSRHEPEVVSSVPATGAKRPVRMAKMTPELARLPRP
jgi:putative FmdB family regulatory protein